LIKKLVSRWITSQVFLAGERILGGEPWTESPRRVLEQERASSSSGAQSRPESDPFPSPTRGWPPPQWPAGAPRTWTRPSAGPVWPEQPQSRDSKSTWT
jgi:hypothetical protein